MLSAVGECSVEWPASLRQGQSFRCGMVMPIWNRPSEVRRSLESIRRSKMTGAVLVLVDDASDNTHTKALIDSFVLEHAPVIKIRRLVPVRYRPSMHVALRLGWDLLSRYLQCDYLGVLDSDIAVHANWLQRLYQVSDIASNDYPCFVLSGFNTHRHISLKVCPDYVIKRTVGGVSLLFATRYYADIVHPVLTTSLWDWQLMGVCAHRGIPVLATRPSVVQHTGRHGAWSRGRFLYDVAWDYDMPFLSSHILYYRLLRLIDHGLNKAVTLLTKVGR